jgi:hypothetical protein
VQEKVANILQVFCYSAKKSVLLHPEKTDKNAMPDFFQVLMRVKVIISTI